MAIASPQSLSKTTLEYMDNVFACPILHEKQTHTWKLCFWVFTQKPWYKLVIKPKIKTVKILMFIKVVSSCIYAKMGFLISKISILYIYMKLNRLKKNSRISKSLLYTFYRHSCMRLSKHSKFVCIFPWIPWYKSDWNHIFMLLKSKWNSIIVSLFFHILWYKKVHIFVLLS